MTTARTPVDEHELRLPDGRRLRYGHRNSNTAVTFVLVHGWPDSWRSFEPVLDALPADVGAISVSLAGFGGSDPRRGTSTPDELAADVVALLDQLTIPSATLVGHSLGTLVVQRIAATHPQRVDGLALVGGFRRLADDVHDELWSVVADLTDPIDPGFVRAFQASTLAEPVPDHFFEQLVAESRRAPAAVWRATFAGISSMPIADAAPITAPTLLLWGDRDALVPRSEQGALLAAIPGAQLVVYEGAGHSPNWERPQRVADDLAAFHADVVLGRRHG